MPQNKTEDSKFKFGFFRAKVSSAKPKLLTDIVYIFSPAEIAEITEITIRHVEFFRFIDVP